jgi:hypothetical protein
VVHAVDTRSSAAARNLICSRSASVTDASPPESRLHPTATGRRGQEWPPQLASFNRRRAGLPSLVRRAPKKRPQLPG